VVDHLALPLSAFRLGLQLMIEPVEATIAAGVIKPVGERR